MKKFGGRALKTSEVVKIFGQKGVETSRFIVQQLTRNERLCEAENE